mmetsp:Transcript_2365/g.6336  ORF Transcript_2365/g.6336 Transcript_2365/m.6336 type:complete len:349 (+) Transcript_2365:247-1293(+)
MCVRKQGLFVKDDEQANLPEDGMLIETINSSICRRASHVGGKVLGQFPPLLPRCQAVIRTSYNSAITVPVEGPVNDIRELLRVAETKACRIAAWASCTSLHREKNFWLDNFFWVEVVPVTVGGMPEVDQHAGQLATQLEIVEQQLSKAFESLKACVDDGIGTSLGASAESRSAALKRAELFIKAQDPHEVKRVFDRYCNPSTRVIDTEDGFASALRDLGIEPGAESVQNLFNWMDLDQVGGLDCEALCRSLRMSNTPVVQWAAAMPVASLLGLCLEWVLPTRASVTNDPLRQLAAIAAEDVDCAVESFAQAVKSLLKKRLVVHFDFFPRGSLHFFHRSLQCCAILLGE